MIKSRRITWLLTIICTAFALLAFYSSPNRAPVTRTLLLGLASASIAIPMGGLSALVMTRRGIVARLLFLACVCLTFFPMFLHVSVWDAAFGKLGWLTSIQGQVLTPLLSGWGAASWIHGIAATPQIALVFLIGWTLGQHAHTDQARLETDRQQVFLLVTLPKMLPLVVLSVAWVLLSCSREIAVTDLYQVGTVAEQIYLGYSLAGGGSILGNWAPDQLRDASSLKPEYSIAMFGGLALIASTLFVRLTDLLAARPSDETRPSSSGVPTVATSLLGLTMLGLLVVAPLVNTILRAGFFVRPVNGVPVAGFEVAQLFASIGRSATQYNAELTWSIIIATVSATCILLLTTILVWLTIDSSRMRHWWKALFVLLLAGSCSVPGPLIGSTISSLLSHSQNTTVIWLYDRTILAPVVANVIFCWPIAAMLNWFLLRSITSDMIDSSKLDGANYFQSLIQIGVIGNLRTLTGCWLLTFALCFGELSASQLVLPPGIDTLPRLMLGLLHAGVDEMTAGLAIAIGFAIIGCTLVGCWLASSNDGRSFGRSV